MRDDFTRVAVLVADSHPEDRMVFRQAFAEARMYIDLRFAVDAADLRDYLRRRGSYAVRRIDAPCPDLILLDLDLADENGLEILQEIKSAPEFEAIPVIAMTGSTPRQQVHQAHALGATSVVVKPKSYKAIRDMVRCLEGYWHQATDLEACGVEASVA